MITAEMITDWIASAAQQHPNDGICLLMSPDGSPFWTRRNSVGRQEVIIQSMIPGKKTRIAIQGINDHAQPRNLDAALTQAVAALLELPVVDDPTNGQDYQDCLASLAAQMRDCVSQAA
jgi:hypothetical protein